MPARSQRTSLLYLLLLTTLAASTLTFLYEAAKQYFLPRITLWQSHIITICFVMVVGTLAVYFTARRLQGLNQQLEADNAARERISKSLQQSEARYRSLFERNKAGVFRTTTEGRFLDCNEAFAEMFGYRRAELLKLTADVLYPGGKAERDARREEFRAAPEEREKEMCYRRKDGSPVWLIQNVNLFKQEDGTEIAEGTLVDITDRHNLEERLRQSQNQRAVATGWGARARELREAA